MTAWRECAVCHDMIRDNDWISGMRGQVPVVICSENCADALAMINKVIVPPDPVDVFELVKNDLDERNRKGMIEYGKPLRPFDGRNSLRDAYEEVLDLAMYLRKLLIEQEAA